MKRWISRGTAKCDGVRNSSQIISPTGLKLDRVVIVKKEARSTDAGGERRAGGKADCCEREYVSEVAVIAGRKVHVDSPRRRRHQNAIDSIEPSRITETLNRAPAVRNRVTEVVDDGVVDRFIEIVAVVRTDNQNDFRARSHGVRPFNIERDLIMPAGGATTKMSVIDRARCAELLEVTR